MNVEQVVKWLYENSFKILKLRKNSKVPLAVNGVYSARVVQNHTLIEGSNIGVACGNGLIVVDVDPRNNGLQTLANWKEAGFNIPETISVLTAQKGMHFYLKGHVPNTKFEGIDIISAGKYVVGPTSVVNNQEYTFINSPEHDYEIADTPEWLIELCSQTRKQTIERAESDTCDLNDIETMLTYIDPDIGYEEWVRIGMAIHSTDSGLPGYSLWLKWSRGELWHTISQKFDSNTNALVKKWESFSHDGGITAGTIFYLAEPGLKADTGILRPKEVVPVEELKTPKPVPVVELPALPIPKEGLLARLYEEFMANAYEPIPVFAMGASISVLSALTQMAYTVGGATRLRSYNLILGPAGSGKNDYLEIAKGILKEVSSRAGNILLLSDEVRSSQALKSILSDYNNRMLITDEWTDMLERAYAYKKDMIAYETTTLLKMLWGNINELEGSRKRNKDESIKPISNPRVSILGAGVPSKLFKLMENPGFISDGLMSRIDLWVHKGKGRVKYKASYKAYRPNDDLIRDLTALFLEPMDHGVDPTNGCRIQQVPFSRTVSVPDEVASLLHAEAERINNMHLDEMESSLAGRIFERFLMYAGLYAIGRNSKTICPQDIHSFALPLFRYQFEQARALVAKQRQMEHLKEIVLVLKFIPRDSYISLRELHHRSIRFRRLCPKMPDKIAYVQNLQTDGYVELNEKGEPRLLTIPTL